MNEPSVNTSSEDWQVEIRYGNKAWHQFADAHVGRRDTHSLEYCLDFVRQKRTIFSDGMRNDIFYRLHDHVSGGVIPLEALGL